MDSSIVYWALIFSIFIILILITDVEVAVASTALIMLIKFSIYPCSPKESFEEESEDVKSSPPAPKKKQLPTLPASVIKGNIKTLENVLKPKTQTADDRIFNASIESGLKAKKSLDIRSHWNNNNWKKYYEYELGIHEDENREWWSNNERELSQKHLVI
jgi:hypothetical protein